MTWERAVDPSKDQLTNTSQVAAARLGCNEPSASMMVNSRQGTPFVTYPRRPCPLNIGID
jgi:hypothetical protein